MTEMIETLLNNRWTITLPEHRAARPEWKTGWETERLDALFFDIANQEKPVVYDVGTEEGDMTGLYSQWGAEVHAFEPNPLVWPNIRAIWEANRLKDLAGYFVGFCAADTDRHPENIEPIIAEPDRDGWPACAYGELIGNHGFRTIFERSGDTPRIKIDDYVQDHTPPTLITMDVEGAEFEVLKGAEQTIIDYMPNIYISVHPEFMFAGFDTYEADMHLWLRQRGYIGTHLAYDHEHHWKYVPGETS